MSADTTKSTTPRIALPAITGEIDKSQALLFLPESLQPWRPTMFSYTASLASTIVGFPLDTIKTRMQTHYFVGPIDCLKKTVKHEGIRGLFRGIAAPLLSISFSKSMGVGLYTYFKPKVSTAQATLLSSLAPNMQQNLVVDPGNSNNALAIERQRRNLTLLNIPTSFISGSLTGVSVSFFACPFEFSKLYSQIIMLESRRKSNLLSGSPQPQLNTQTIPKPIVTVSQTSTAAVVKQIVKAEGILGLYSGIKFHLIREFISSGLYFAVYETAKLTINNSVSNLDGKISGTNISVGPISIAVAGALSGVISWITIFPIDTVKSLTQRDIVSNIIRHQNGLEKIIIKRKLTMPTRRMYRGLSVSVTRSVLNSIVFFGAFEYLMTHIA